MVTNTLTYDSLPIGCEFPLKNHFDIFALNGVNAAKFILFRKHR